MPSTAIAYSLTIGGSPASGAVLGAIRSIEVEDHAALADMLQAAARGRRSRRTASGWTVLDDGSSRGSPRSRSA